MPIFYADTETEGFDPEKYKLLTFQYQELDYEGKLKGKLIILKEWEIGEEKLVKSAHKLLLSDNVWDYIPLMYNSIFDLTFLFEKFKKYNLPLKYTLSEYLYKYPLIDLKSSCIMANNLNFKGSGLDQITNKKIDGRMIPEWYNNKEYKKIEDYIIQEKDSFMEFFQLAKNKLIDVKKEIKNGKM